MVSRNAASMSSRRTTGYKLPKRIEFRSEPPKTPIGKILRRELKKQAEQDGPAARA